MKIYTKTGDDGTTALFGGKRVPKSDLRIDTYGTVDELNAYIGLLSDFAINASRKEFLVRIQDRLFTIGAILAVEPGNTKVKVPRLSDEDVLALEKEIDRMTELLPPLSAFILPGGHKEVSFAHIARTVCRRAERLAVALNGAEAINAKVLVFLNRLSDYLFVLARMMAHDLHCEDRSWTPEM